MSAAISIRKGYERILPIELRKKMKTKIQFKSVKKHLILWFIVVALLPTTAIMSITYIKRAAFIKEEVFDKLRAIRDLKVNQVNTWIDERIGDILTVSQDREIRDIEKLFARKQHTSNYVQPLSNVRKILENYLRNYRAYHELFIINPISGRVEVSTNKQHEGTDRSTNPYFTEPMRTKQVYIKGIYYSETLRKTSMAIATPVFCPANQGKHIVGIIVARIYLEDSLYALILKRTGMGKTGETLIVNKDRFALNELRWHERAPLKLKIAAESASLASQGKTGILECRDYRGEKVLSAYTHIEKAGWEFVAKQDLKEIYAPIRSMIRDTLILFFFSALLVYILAIVLAGGIARPVLEMTKIAKNMAKGDFSARNVVASVDELGYLAQSFNSMADSVASQIEIQKGTSEIRETMLNANELTAFRKNILRKLLEVTDSNMGAYCLHNPKNHTFEHVTSIGIGTELLEPFDASIFEGEFGNILATKSISHIKNIPEDTVFKFKTFIGTVLPKEIITIPVVIDNIVESVISIGSLNAYSKESLEILNHVWIVMNTGISNLLANDKTRRLAAELNEKNQELEAQAEELKAQAEELQSQAEELQQTSEELQEQNLELQAQRQQVEETNRLKSEFLSNMSHELRTPLNSVMALSRVLMMQAKEKLSEKEWSYLEIIERNGKNLLSLINNILDLSKIEAGKIDVSPKLFPLSSTVETIMERLEPLAQDKGIKLGQEIPDDLPLIESDIMRVDQILQNLVGNAIKFTDQGSVTVSAHKDAENIYIEVSDTGIGISNKDLPHIFEEFRQVDGTSARSYEGTGLGLSIAYRAARMLGGTISVKSTSGEGSTFTLILPIRWQGIAPVYTPEISKAPAGIEPAPKTVLVVDDEPNALTMISDYLSGEGYNIITATSGEEAIRLAQRHLPFAITLDLIMPEMDGLEVLQELKKRPETANIPVLIVSVSDDRETGIALGAVGFITKPVNKELLIAEINRIGGPSPYSIVVADDNEIDRNDMARAIEQEGMKAIIAENGNICMDLIKEAVPDILVLDLIMPEMDGFQVLDRVRSDPESRDLPVIVVTAKDLSAEEKKKLRGNVSSVLAKSHTTSTALLEKIRKIFAGIERRKKDAKAGGREAFDRILMVEDNEAAIIQIKAVLEHAGYIVDVARGGQEALDYMSRIIPCGIILDLMMPEVDGFQVLDKMRGTKATAKVPVLVLTARDLTPEDLSKLSANNIQQLIQKGDIDRQGLLFKIRSMLGGKPRVGFETGNLKLETPKPGAEQSETVRSKGGQARIQHRKMGTEQPARGKAGKSATILVVEDNPDNMTSIKAVLQNKYEILEATDGEKGLNMALTGQPDLVLLDMSLPKMDGFTVVRKVKEDREAGSIPVIGLTARAMKGDRKKVIDAGCDDYISKPIDPEKVLAKLGKWLSGSED